MTEYNFVKGTNPCPACRDEGNDDSGDNFHWYGDEKGGYCFACHFTVNSKEYSGNGKEGDKRKVSSNNLRSSRPKALPSDYKTRKITEEDHQEILDKTVNTLDFMFRGVQRYNHVNTKNDFRYEVEDGKVVKMYSPCYYYDGNERVLTGYNVRCVDPKDFYMKGFVSPDHCEFHGKSYNPRIAETLIIVGGQIDYITVQGAIDDLMKKYKSHNINVVSGVNGEMSTIKHVKADYDWVVGHKKIILALDNDDAGQEATDKLLDILPTEQCFLANFGEFKDPNEYRLDTQQLCQDIYWNVRPVDDFGIMTAEELYEEGLRKLEQDKIPLPDMLHDLKPYFTDGEIGRGEWINIIAGTSTGKSTLIDGWKDEWIDICPYPQAVNSFEASSANYGIKTVSSFSGINISKISGKEERIAYYKEQEHTYKSRVTNIDGKTKFYFVSKIPKTIEHFKKMLLRLVKVNGVGVLWIDPALSLKAMCETDKQFEDLLTWIDQVIRVEHNTLIVTVQHARKNLSSGKNASEGGGLSEEDGSGSRVLISLATINIGIERNKSSNDYVIRNTTIVHIFKNRPDDVTRLGAAKLFYRAKANRLYPFSIAREHNFFKDDFDKDTIDIDINDKGKSLDGITTDMHTYDESGVSKYVEEDAPRW